MEEQGYISIFKGSSVEADQVNEYLKQHHIGSLVRNHMQESLSAAWVSDAAHAAEVFVYREDLGKARELLRNIFHEGDSTLTPPPTTPTKKE